MLTVFQCDYDGMRHFSSQSFSTRPETGAASPAHRAAARRRAIVRAKVHGESSDD